MNVARRKFMGGSRAVLFIVCTLLFVGDLPADCAKNEKEMDDEISNSSEHLKNPTKSPGHKNNANVADEPTIHPTKPQILTGSSQNDSEPSAPTTNSSISVDESHYGSSEAPTSDVTTIVTFYSTTSSRSTPAASTFDDATLTGRPTLSTGTEEIPTIVPDIPPHESDIDISLNFSSTNHSVNIYYKVDFKGRKALKLQLKTMKTKEFEQERSISKRNGTVGTVTFNSLQSATNYSLLVLERKHHHFNFTVLETDLQHVYTDPNPPANVQCKLISHTVMDISITPADDETVDMLDYEVIQADSEDVDSLNTTKISKTKFQVTNFQNDSIYEFNVTTLFYERASPPYRISCRTSGIPTEVREFRNTSLMNVSVSLAWKKPEYTNGDQFEYKMTFKNEEHEDRETVSSAKNHITLNYENGIRAGQTHTFEISAGNEFGFGNLTLLNVTVPIYAPYYIEPNKKEPTFQRIDDKSNEIMFRITDPFTDRHGPITNYSIIVTDRNNLHCPLQSISQYPRVPYYAVYQCQSMFKEKTGATSCAQGHRRDSHFVRPSAAFITLGQEKDCMAPGPSSHGCNGDPRSNSTVYLLLVACTEAGCSCAPASESVTTAALPTSNGSLSVMIVLSVIIALLLSGTAIVIVCRKKLIAMFLSPAPAAGMIKLKKEPSSHRVLTSKPIPVEKFVDIVKDLSRDSGLKFSEDFEDLKNVGRCQSSDQAEIQGNRAKNRFANILPYDLTRVKLLPTEDEECSDYINANWIPGFHSKREYIATQGPMPATKDDFWRMLWEYNCPGVVMLTLCVEKSRTKCDMYWPVDQEPVLFGDLQVALLNETKNTEWHIREFELKTNNQTRTLKHYHYLEWPDMNVPSASSLLEFIKTVRDKLGAVPLNGPIVVHCSAGVGRSGTFIALDSILEQLKVPHDGLGEPTIDIYGIVYKLRQSRVLMVQTEQQYIFLYECIKRVLEKADCRLSFFEGRNSRYVTDVSAIVETSADQRVSTESSVADDDNTSKDDNEASSKETTSCIIEVEEEEATKASDEREDEGIGNNED